MSDTKNDETVINAYKQVSAVYEEVGSDTGQPIIVEGDSLVLDILHDPELDTQHGGQFLHYIYALEKALERITGAGRSIHVIFYDVLSSVWKQPAHLALRELTIRHLDTNSAFTVHRFANWWTSKMVDFVDTYDPAFMLVGEGSSSVDGLLCPKYAVLFKALTIHFLSRSVQCVRSTEVTYSSHRLFGFQMYLPYEITSANRNINIVDPADYDACHPLVAAASALDLSALSGDGAVAPSAALLSAVCVKLLSEGSSNDGQADATDGLVFLTKALLAHSFLCQNLPLKYRALHSAANSSTVFVQADVSVFLQDVYVHVPAALRALPGSIEGKALASLCDLVDGRMLHFLVSLMRSSDAASLAGGFGFNQSTQSAFAALWTSVVTKAGLAAASFPLGPFFSSPNAVADAYAVSEKTGAKKVYEKKIEAEPVKEVAEVAAEEEEEEEEQKTAPADAEEDGAGSDDDWEALVSDDEEAKPADGDSDDDMGWEALGSDSEDEDKDEKDDAADEWDADSDDDKEPSPAAAPAAAAAAAPAAEAEAEAVDNGLPKVSDFTSKLMTAAVPDVEDMLSRMDTLTPAERTSLESVFRDTRWKQNIFMDYLDGIPVVEEQKTKIQMKQWQKYLSYMSKYAQSLKGGKIVLRDVIIAPTAEKKEKKKQSHHKGGKKGGGKGGKKGKGRSNVKDLAQAEVMAKKIAAEQERIQRYITVASQQSTLEGKIAYLDSQLLARGEKTALPGQIQLLKWCFDAWKVEKLKGNMTAAIRVFQLIFDIHRRFQEPLTGEDIVVLQRILLMLGFVDAADYICKEWQRNHKGVEAAFVTDYQHDREFQDFKVGMSCARFQLAHGGPSMIRDVESVPDDRVSGFYPDRWQRDLLDVVDNDESALVVAPTSSGKTFVSYYTMKKVLTENIRIKTSTKSGKNTTKGVIVYVAPTKALVNQIAADVYNHYGPVYGVYTETYHSRPVHCEVLITVPECVERLLMSSIREEWAVNIKYAIFDEVHCVGEEGGDVWERLLQLLPCPFLALSATVGNPNMFFSWLKRVSDLHSFKIRLIVHPHRWSDLQKFVYLPEGETVLQPSKQITNVADVLKYKVDLTKRSLMAIHPNIALGSGASFSETTEFPADLSFSPSDSLACFDAMFIISRQDGAPAGFVADVNALRPEIFFKDVSYIGKREARAYENKLKATKISWVRGGNKQWFMTVLKQLSNPVMQRMETMQTDAQGQNCFSKTFMRRHFFSLLLELNTKSQLPAVIFCFDQQLCENFVFDTLNKLEEMEREMLESETSSQDQRAKDKAKKAAMKAARRARDKKQTKEEKDEGREAEAPAAAAADDDEYLVDPRFSFLKEGEQMDYGDIKYWMRRMLYKTKWSKDHPLVRAIRRGFGVHHGGLPRAYRDLVETLFRGKHLKFVIATKTLALGINMPCRSVVFAGDDKALNPLAYRQMSGRAGRRGYDNVGNVVFFAVNPLKIYRLLKSPLVKLRGHFPLTPSLVSRMVTVHSQVYDKAKYAKVRAQHIQTCTYMHRGKPEACVSYATPGVMKEILFEMSAFWFQNSGVQ